MKPVSRQIEVRGLAGDIKVCQGQSDPINLVSTYFAAVSALIQAPKASMPECLDHALMYRVPVRM